jgi:hypothetical protein
MNLPFITVSGNVTDPKGIPYAGGIIVPILTVSGSPLLPDGSPYVPPIGPFALDSLGNFAFQLAANNQIRPANSTWSFIIASAQGTVPIAFGKQSISFTVSNLTLNADTNITTQISAVVQDLTFATGGGGGGTVTAVQAGSLNPLFTTTVSAPNTTPNIQFLQQTASANTLFGNASGASANPVFFAPSGDVALNAGAFNVDALHFGPTQIPLSTTAPTAGQVLAFDGSNIVGATPPPAKVIAKGSFTIGGTIPANGTLVGSINTTGGAVSDLAVVTPGSQTLGVGMTNMPGWNTGALLLLWGMQGNGGSIVWTVVNSSSSAIVVTAGQPSFSYMVLR